MKATRIAVAFLLSFLAGASSSCELGTFECHGIDPVSGGPLCFCTANGLLCGHSGFAPCGECPSEVQP